MIWFTIVPVGVGEFEIVWEPDELAWGEEVCQTCPITFVPFWIV